MKKAYSILRRNSTVLSFNINSTKFTDGKDTGKRCITAFVRRKPANEEETRELEASGNFLPKEIDGVLIDVIELSNPDYEVGETSISRLNPFLQKKLAGGLRRG